MADTDKNLFPQFPQVPDEQLDAARKLFHKGIGHSNSDHPKFRAGVSTPGTPPLPDALENRPPINHVLLIAGPGKDDFGHMVWDKKKIAGYADKLRAAGATVTVVGDGERNITLKEVQDAIAAQNENTTVMPIMHGESTVIDGENKARDLLLLTAGEHNTQIHADRIFESMGETSREKHITMDCMAMSCGGGAGIDAAAEFLPHNAVFAAASNSRSTTLWSNADRFFDSLENNHSLKGHFTADRLLDHYMMNGLQDIYPPALMAGGKDYNMNEQYASRLQMLGERLTEEDKTRVRERLKDYDPALVEAAIQRVQTGEPYPNTDEGRRNFGRDMAVVNAAEHHPLLTQNSSKVQIPADPLKGDLPSPRFHVSAAPSPMPEGDLPSPRFRTSPPKSAPDGVQH